MPWKEASTMSLRFEFVQLVIASETKIRRLCRRFGVSPKTAYKWLHRYHEGGRQALADRSRRPHQSPAQTSPQMEQLVVHTRQRYPAWGARKLRRWLLERGHRDLPSPSTITAILQRNGCIAETDSQKHQAFQRFEAPTPNALWQMDFKGYFPLLDRRCHPLTILDDYSRYSIGLYACCNQRQETVEQLLISTFRRYGMPHRILTDNGGPWGSSGYDAYSVLAVWLLRLGITLSHSRIYHPQTLGKDERFHRTLQMELLARRTFLSLDDCQRHFDSWRNLYNFQRPHEALDMAVPGSRYHPSSREYPETLPPIEYGAQDIVRKVDHKGDISFRGRRFRIGKSFYRYPLGLRPTTADGVYTVFFCHQQIAQINLNNDIENP